MLLRVHEGDDDMGNKEKSFIKVDGEKIYNIVQFDVVKLPESSSDYGIIDVVYGNKNGIINQLDYLLFILAFSNGRSTAIKTKHEEQSFKFHKCRMAVICESTDGTTIAHRIIFRNVVKS